MNHKRDASRDVTDCKSHYVMLNKIITPVMSKNLLRVNT